MGIHSFDKNDFNCYYKFMLSGLLKGLKDLIYPNHCLACRKKIETTRQDDPACSSCWAKIEHNLPPFCAVCGRHLDAKAIQKNTCSHCLNAKFYFNRAFGPFLYTGVIKKLIHEFKYNGKDYLKEPLGSLMNTFIREYSLPVEHLDFIIPIPLHKSRQRERGFNQAQLLGAQVAEEFNKNLFVDLLIRSKPAKTQTELALEERRRNVEKSFLVTSPGLIKDKNLLLIDDVLTTGATANEAARTLKEAGANTVLLLTLAN